MVVLATVSTAANALVRQQHLRTLTPGNLAFLGGLMAIYINSLSYSTCNTNFLSFLQPVSSPSSEQYPLTARS